MVDDATMTVRLSRELKGRLAAPCGGHQAFRSLFLAAEAIAAYVDARTWQLEAIRRAVEKADAGGPFVRDQDATRYLDALAAGEDPEPPRTFRAR